MSARHAQVAALVIVLGLALGAVALCLGPVAFSPARVLAALTGEGEPWERAVIVDLRLPRV
ncbi:MAG: iron ABC transporter permease, partial [Deltaproteobacteria bacterium]|nr:iron ABC transporter permease [Deltaproteobacteria bacterium]